MKIFLRLFLILAAISAITFPTFAGTEFWNLDTFQFSLQEKVKFNVIPELRWKDNATNFYLYQVYLGPVFSINKNFDFAAYYLPKNSKSGTTWTFSNLGVLDFIYKNPDFYSFSARNRFEYDSSNANLKYRCQLQLKNQGWFISEEPFYNFSKNFIDENRASFGYGFKVVNNFEAYLGYMLRSQKSVSLADWTNTDVWFVNASVKF
ncbi:MAG: DUF2490 domain-containing protein [Candidatus Saganbacteria bacterium]|nr:DUF2490 domain-containing protein [Candidatus Saganbacteria bacterium]